MRTHVSMFVSKSVCMYVCARVYVCVYVCMCMCVCVCMHVHVARKNEKDRMSERERERQKERWDPSHTSIIPCDGIRIRRNAKPKTIHSPDTNTLSLKPWVLRPYKRGRKPWTRACCPFLKLFRLESQMFQKGRGWRSWPLPAAPGRMLGST